jgi:hypothetical protein
VERLEAEKRHLVEVLAAHAPSCAKRPRRSSSNSANNAPGGGDGNDYCLLPTDSNGHHGSLYPHGPQPDIEAVSFPELKYSVHQNALLPDTTTSGAPPFLDAPDQAKTAVKDDGKQRRHFKSSCSFARTTGGPSQDQQYFFAAKSRCLSYGFQMDNRCVAL